MVTFCLCVVQTMAIYILGKTPQQAVTLHVTLMLCIPLLDSFSDKTGTQCCMIDTASSCSISHIPNHFATLPPVFSIFRFHIKMWLSVCCFLCLVYSILRIHLWCPKGHGLLKQDDIPLHVCAYTHTTHKPFTRRLLKGPWSCVEFLFSLSWKASHDAAAVICTHTTFASIYLLSFW